MFGSRFFENGSTDSEKVCSFGNYESRASFLLLQPVKNAWPVANALPGWLIGVILLSMHCINGWCHIAVAVNPPMRVGAWECMNVFGTSDSKQALYTTVTVG